MTTSIADLNAITSEHVLGFNEVFDNLTL